MPGILHFHQVLGGRRFLVVIPSTRIALFINGVVFCGDQEQQWATELIARCKIQLDNESLELKRQPDTSIRHAFLTGNQTAVSRYLDRLSGREHDFFNILAESIHNTPEDIYFELIDQLNDADFPEHLRGEALFYLGSLAIEAGDSQSAVNAFSASIQAAPTQPLNSISRVSLMNLQKGSR